MALTSSVAVGSRAEPWGSIARIALATVIAAVLANILVYFVGDAVVGYDPEFVVLSNVSGAILITLVPTVVAMLLYAVLRRRTTNPARLFTIIAAAVFVVTTIPDFTYIPGVEGASTGQTAVLILIHVVAAAVIVGMLTNLTRPRGHWVGRRLQPSACRRGWLPLQGVRRVSGASIHNPCGV